MLAAPDAPVISDCYMNIDGLAVVSWLPSAKPDEHQVPGSEFFVDYNEVGKCTSFSSSSTPSSVMRCDHGCVLI